MALISNTYLICTYESLNRKRLIHRRVLFLSTLVLCVVGIFFVSWCSLSRPVEAPEVKKYAQKYEPKPQTSIKKEITPEIKEKASFQVLD